MSNYFFKILGFILLFSIWLFASDKSIYLKKGADIIDIGKLEGYNEMEVSKTIVEYEPTLNSIMNTILYGNRILHEESCVIDRLEHEFCPIDKEECADESDYLDGSSIRRHQLKVADPFCSNSDKERLNSNDTGVTFVECFKDSNGDNIIDKASVSIPSLNDFTHIDTVEGQGFWDLSIISNAVVQRKNPGSSTFFVYSPTTNETDNMILEGDFSVDTSLSTEYAGDDDWLGFVFGFKDKNNFHYLHWRRDPSEPEMRSTYTGFTLGRIVNGKLDFSQHTGGTTGHTRLQQNINTYGWKDNGNYKVKIVYNRFYIKAYIAEYSSNGVLGVYKKIIDYNPEEIMVIDGKMGFMNLSNGGSIYKNFRADYCPSGYAVDNDSWNGTSYECKREPDCQNHYEKIRTGDVGVIRCEMEYDYYDYQCPDLPNEYEENYVAQDVGGDCGHVTCTNTSTPPNRNCIRLKHTCPVDGSKKCVSEEKELDYNDFTKWTVENASGGNWEVLNRNSVLQHRNGEPTYFLSNYNLKDGHITMEGIFRTDDPSDNDFFGFVFGFKDTSNYNLLSWSRWKNDTWRGHHSNSELFAEPLIDGEIPLALVNVSNYSGGNWHRNNIEGKYDVLQRYNNGGWSKNIDYKIKLDITSHSVKVWIGEVGKPLHLDIDYYTDKALDITGKLGFFNYSISEVTYKDFTIEWVDGKNINHIEKKVLGVPTVEGEYIASDYGLIKGFECGKNCKYALSNIYIEDKHRLCFEDRVGDKGCFTFSDECNLSGKIQEDGILSEPLFSFLNTADESIPNYHTQIKESHKSPTGIALDFEEISGSSYILESVKPIAKNGDKLTVDFWLNWDGESEGVIFGFQEYALWISKVETNNYTFGFSNKDSDIFGISDASILKSGWHRVTAIFTHADDASNKIYIDGKLQQLTNNVISGKATFDGSDILLKTTAYTTDIGDWGIEEYFEVNTSKIYTMQGTVKIDSIGLPYNNSWKPRQYLGFISYDADKKIIRSEHIMKFFGATDTYLLEDLKPGDTKLILDDASGWYNTRIHNDKSLNHDGSVRYESEERYYSQSFLWYGYQNSFGHTYQDYTYTRNYSGRDMWDAGAIQQVGSRWEITLNRPWTGALIQKGTAIRNGDAGGTYNYAVWAGETLEDGIHTKSASFGGEIITDGSNHMNKFRAGTKYIKPLILSNYYTDTPVKVAWSEITMTRNNSGLAPNANNDSDITNVMQLSGIGERGANPFHGKIAGINVYDGELSQSQILRRYKKEHYAGINYIKVHKETIEGFDANNTSLGTITSTCNLSGKVGDIGRDVKKLCAIKKLVPRGRESTQRIQVTYSKGNGDKLGYGNNIIAISETGTYEVGNVWTYCGHAVSPALESILYGNPLREFYLDSSGHNINFCDGGGTDGNWYYYKDNSLSNCEKDGKAVTYEGRDYCEYQEYTDGTCLADIEIVTADFLDISVDINGEVLQKFYNNGKVADPIVSAKVINNRIEFWDGFTRGSIGYIEAVKYTKDKDEKLGYSHEFKESKKLYDLGFTAFTSSENNITYAISNHPMTTSNCLNYIAGTNYFLSDRNVSDEIEMKLLEILTPYLGGYIGDYCVIEKNGIFNNYVAEFSTKETIKEKVYETFVCSKWSCINHQCGVASCKDGFNGTTIKKSDRGSIDSGICIDQECDMNFDYFAVCGSKASCPDYSAVFQKENGSCVKAICNIGDSLNSKTGKCETIGCKNSIERGGKCFKSF